MDEFHFWVCATHSWLKTNKGTVLLVLPIRMQHLLLKQEVQPFKLI